MIALGLPPEASTIAPRVDLLLYAVTAVTGTVAIAIFVTMIVFGIRYRARSSAPRADDIPALQARARRRVETAWTLIPLALFIASFAWAARLYMVRATAPANAIELFVVAKQWMWKLQHPGGQREIDEMHIPRGQPVKLVMTSQDVIHSFFVPAFRLKQDVLPGRYTEMWFTATKTGRFHLFCAEYCGTDHARMGGDVVVMEPAEFAKWLNAHRGGEDMASRGADLFRQFGCSGCHGANASVHAPNLAGLYGRPVPLSDGTTVVADERYVRDSILLPRREVAAGYAPIMPSFAGQISEDDILDLIAYIKSLADTSERPR
ncbi:MAG TPA: cytochrome c oxidase subunit II [Casimicrobiaceae bacterium]|jgi:cytochrome c oxidase subunit 2|nr:cytochrome c oxidase subunit II [Casimicrobiaceae bacterium]